MKKRPDYVILTGYDNRADPRRTRLSALAEVANTCAFRSRHAGGAAAPFDNRFANREKSRRNHSTPCRKVVIIADSVVEVKKGGDARKHWVLVNSQHKACYTTISRYLVANNALNPGDNPERVRYTRRHY